MRALSRAAWPIWAGVPCTPGTARARAGRAPCRHWMRQQQSLSNFKPVSACILLGSLQLHRAPCEAASRCPAASSLSRVMRLQQAGCRSRAVRVRCPSARDPRPWQCAGLTCGRPGPWRKALLARAHNRWHRSGTRCKRPVVLGACVCAAVSGPPGVGGAHSGRRAAACAALHVVLLRSIDVGCCCWY